MSPRVKSLRWALDLEGTLWGERSRAGERTGVGVGERGSQVLGTGDLVSSTEQLEISAAKD